IGFTGLFLQRTLIRQGLAQLRRQPHQYAGFVVIVLVSLWVAYFAHHSLAHYDDGLYHLQDLKWAEQYPIIPGLGNIHGRLGFNNALNLWLAMLNQTPLLPQTAYIGGGLLATVFILQLVWNAWCIVRRQVSWAEIPVYRYFLALHLPVVLFVAQSANSPNLSSLKNDFPVSILTILLAAELIRILIPFRKQTLQSRTELDYELFSFTALVCAAISIKLSAAVAGACLLLALLIYMLKTTHYPLQRMVLIVGVTGVLITGVWLVRGGILSGYPLYPSTLIALPVDWRVDPEVAQTESTGIQSWARIPGGDPETVLANWNWLTVWWEANHARLLELIIPLVMIGAAGLLLIYGWLRRHDSALPGGMWLLLSMLPGLLIWFTYAPDLRFGWQNLWIVAAWLGIISLWQIPRLKTSLRPITGVLVGGLTALVVLNLAVPASISPNAVVYPETPTQNFYTYHGLKVNVPVNNAQCWDAPLPCTPYPNYLVGLRQSGDMRQGFKLEVIEPDKGAFALAEIIQSPDIVPQSDVDQIKVGELPVNGLLVGQGWQALEDWGTGRQRWVDNLAQLYVTRPDTAHKRLALTVASGPSMNQEPFQLYLLDEQQHPVGSAMVTTEETTITFDLNLTNERVQIFYLYCDSLAQPAPNDGRVLNFRVTEIQWQDTGQFNPWAQLQELLNTTLTNIAN
ncbi:MAG TPA: hypothetical protein VHL11_08930, partial [Phototrophicaceae bacterium]|nr:hypothetical protein [Phototrophicaceae bacterium]